MTRMVQAAIGAATASFVPTAAAAAAGGHPGCLVLGAVCGCLPDVLDDVRTTFSRPPDLRVVPDPADPGGCNVAKALAGACDRVRGGARPETVRVEAPPVRPGVHLCCRLALEPGTSTFEVTFHHVAVDDGGNEAAAGREVARRQRATSTGRILIEDDVSALARPGGGAVVALLPAGRDGVRVVFEPDRRRGSHSLAAAGAVALCAWAALDGAAAVVAAASMLGHIACEHLRSGGVAWFYPLERRRRRSVRGRGVGWLADPLLATGASVAAVGWNLCRFAAGPQPVDGRPGWRAAGLLLAAVVLAVRGGRWARGRLLKPRAGHRLRPARPARPAAGGE